MREEQGGNAVTHHKIGTREEWLAARKEYEDAGAGRGAS